MIDLIFVFNLVNVEKPSSEMELEGKLKCNKYIQFLITMVKEICVYGIFFFELVIVIVNDEKAYHRIYSIKKTKLKLHIKATLVMLQIVINF